MHISYGRDEGRENVCQKTRHPHTQEVLSKSWPPNSETWCLSYWIPHIPDLVWAEGLPGMDVVGQGPTSEAPDRPGTLPNYSGAKN